MIRPTLPADSPTLIELARATGVFKSFEITALGEVLDDYHATNHAQGHRAISFEQVGEIVGFAYYAPAAMTDRSWYLYWIAVARQTQAHGIGGTLLKQVEEDIRASNGRILFIETSSLGHYDLTRKFYLKHRYEQAAVLPDFYADGDNLVVYSKRLNA
jgi:ribosomal protein S18 acetylase RimI-like enzyme